METYTRKEMCVILDGLIRDLKDASYSIEFSDQTLNHEDLKIITEKINKIIVSTENIFMRLEKK